MKPKTGGKKREIIQHALGLHRSKVSYRNFYCAYVGGDDYELLEQMVVEGLLKHGLFINDERDRYYHVTPLGEDYLKELESK